MSADALITSGESSFPAIDVEKGKLMEERNPFKDATDRIAQRVEEEFQRLGDLSTEGVLLQLRNFCVKPVEIEETLPNLLAKVQHLRVSEDLDLDERKRIEELTSQIQIDILGKHIPTQLKPAFRNLNTAFKQFAKTLRKEKAGKTIVEAKQPPYQERTLRIQEVAKARFSHSTIASRTAHGESVSLETLQRNIEDNGWRPGAAALRIYIMPDGQLTSYDNRRLMVIRNIVNANPNSLLLIPVHLYEHNTVGNKKDIRSLAIDLKNVINLEKCENVDQRVERVRLLLLSEARSEEAPFTPNTNLHYLFLRIYQDAGKSEALSRCEFQVLQSHEVIFGYHTALIRES